MIRLVILCLTYWPSIQALGNATEYFVDDQSAILFDAEYYDVQIDECVSNCQVQLLERAREKIGDKSLKDQLTSSALKPVLVYNKTVLENLCSVYKPLVSCIESCPTSNEQTEAVNSLFSVRTLCITKYKDFMESMPCLERVENEYKSICDNKCGVNSELSQNTNRANIRSQLTSICNNLKCRLNCGAPYLENICGKHTRVLAHGFIIDSLKEANKDKADQLSSLWPKQCLQLINHSNAEKLMNKCATNECSLLLMFAAVCTILINLNL